MPGLLQRIKPNITIDVEYSDLHCHVLPGLDDGPRDLASSMELARKAKASGAKRIVATPHSIPGAFEPDPRRIKRLVAQLNRALAAQALDLEIIEGCEAYLSERLCQDVVDGRILPIGGSRYVLVEFPSMSMPAGALEELSRLQKLGAGVILAHPERNVDLRRGPSMVRKMAESGILLQVNAGSLVGVYGKSAAAFAGDLFREGLAHFIGSDAHSGRSPALKDSGPDVRPALAKVFRSSEEAKRFIAGAEERFEALLSGNLG